MALSVEVGIGVEDIQALGKALVQSCGVEVESLLGAMYLLIHSIQSVPITKTISLWCIYPLHIRHFILATLLNSSAVFFS
jgi:hypothetical protein